MQNNDKKVLLRISNLKQYFPLKGGRFVKANDGITLDIYEGETFGLVGESGCGKSTLGRTILQLYHQTYGRTMYYGRSLDDLAPKYVIDTVKNLKARRTKLRELEQKRDKLEAEYAKLSEKEQYAKHGELDTARKLAEDALLTWERGGGTVDTLVAHTMDQVRQDLGLGPILALQVWCVAEDGEHVWVVMELLEQGWVGAEYFWYPARDRLYFTHAEVLKKPPDLTGAVPLS